MELANKLNANLSMAIESGSIMAGKLKNKNLKNYLFNHVEKYKDLQDSLNQIASTSNKKLKSTNFIAKTFLWMQSQLSSFKNTNESDYVESFIKGSEMGIESSSKLLHKYSTANYELKDLALSLQSMELENIDKLKDYLKRTDY